MLNDKNSVFCGSKQILEHSNTARGSECEVQCEGLFHWKNCKHRELLSLVFTIACIFFAALVLMPTQPVIEIFFGSIDAGITTA